RLCSFRCWRPSSVLLPWRWQFSMPGSVKHSFWLTPSLHALARDSQTLRQGAHVGGCAISWRQLASCGTPPKRKKWHRSAFGGCGWRRAVTEHGPAFGCGGWRCGAKRCAIGNGGVGGNGVKATCDRPATGKCRNRDSASGSVEPVPSGQVIENPMSGERIVIVQSGEETHGQLLAFDLFLPPGGHVPAAHTHPNQEEHFSVVEGTLRFRIGRREVLATPGDAVTIKPGTPHWFGNRGRCIARVRVEVRPALRMEELL